MQRKADSTTSKVMTNQKNERKRKREANRNEETHCEIRDSRRRNVKEKEEEKDESEEEEEEEEEEEDEEEEKGKTFQMESMECLEAFEWEAEESQGLLQETRESKANEHFLLVKKEEEESLRFLLWDLFW